MNSAVDWDQIIQVFIFISILIGTVGGPILQAFLKKKKDERERAQRQAGGTFSSPQETVREPAQGEVETETVEEEIPAETESDTSPPNLEDVLDEMFGRRWRKQPEEAPPPEPKPARIPSPPPVRTLHIEPEPVVSAPTPEPEVIEAGRLVSAPPSIAVTSKPLMVHHVEGHGTAPDLGDLRKAVVYSEILSPPLALRSESTFD